MEVQKNMPQRKEKEDILEKNPNETEIKEMVIRMLIKF